MYFFVVVVLAKIISISWDLGLCPITGFQKNKGFVWIGQLGTEEPASTFSFCW